LPLGLLEHVSYRYPAAVEFALRDVCVEIEPGEVILVRGPSGSGKSTLLRCLNGLVPHSTGGHMEGKVVIAGLDTRLHPPRELGALFGFVFQHPEAQFITDDVEAELAFGLENLGLPSALIRKRIEEVIDQVGIEPLRHRKINTLSGGERQRVAIAAVLGMHPTGVALDEPTSQLDPQAAEDILQVVGRLVQDLGITVLIAEHRLERVLPLVDQVWTLADGNLGVSPPREAALAGNGEAFPLAALALRARWSEIPLTIREARRHVNAFGAQAASPRTSSGPPIVLGEKLSFAYGDRRVMQDLSLELRSGEVTVLMGRNGSGKTTLLKLVSGLLKPSRGKVMREGVRIAYIPQDADSLLFRRTVGDELKGANESRLRSNLAAFTDRYPRDLSTGERQQVAIAAADKGAQLLLLDEPTRGLDHAVKARLTAHLRERARDGTASLVATHDVEWAARTADRILLMADGEIYADGPPRQVLSDSLVFSTQVNKLLGHGWLVPEDVPIA
jgi:energy-coupling factor transport system ATP-binding protein